MALFCFVAVSNRSYCRLKWQLKSLLCFWIDYESYFSNFAPTIMSELPFKLLIKNDRAITIPARGVRSRFSGSSLNRKVSKKASSEQSTKRKWRAPVSPDKKERFYSVPVMKVRDKCDAFFALRSSRAFCAFYSISFPLNISDDVAFRLLNIWLTRIRRDRKRFDYLWVTERQGNGTIHFHLITNSFLNIRVVNYYMAAAIQTAVDAKECSWGDSSKSLYNGVDVKRVHNSKGVSRYLTKYLTKKKKDKDGNVIELDNRFKHLAWHCSRRVSALFTARIVSGDHLVDFFGQPWFESLGWIQSYNAFSDFSCNLFYFIKQPPNWVTKELRDVNERIWRDLDTVDFVNNLIVYNYGNNFEPASVIVDSHAQRLEKCATSARTKPIRAELYSVCGMQKEFEFADTAVASIG